MLHIFKEFEHSFSYHFSTFIYILLEMHVYPNIVKNTLGTSKVAFSSVLVRVYFGSKIPVATLIVMISTGDELDYNYCFVQRVMAFL